MLSPKWGPVMLSQRLEDECEEFDVSVIDLLPSFWTIRGEKFSVRFSITNRGQADETIKVQQPRP